MKIICDQDLYRSLIPKEAPLYLQPLWMDLFSQNWKAKIKVDKHGRPIWLMPYHVKSRYGFKKYGRVSFCADNGPYFLKHTDTDFFDPGPNRFLSNTIIDDRRNILNPNLMMSEGWRTAQRQYQYFDLKKYPQDFQAVSRSKRKRMKKNSSLKFLHLVDLNEAGTLFLNAFHEIGVDSVTHMDLINWKNQLDQKFDHYIVGIRDKEGNIRSAQWLVSHGGTLYGWQAARHPGFNQTGGRELLVWYIIQWARKKYERYDLGGSSIPGVRQFNLEMGAHEVPYQRYLRFTPGWLRFII